VSFCSGYGIFADSIINNSCWSIVGLPEKWKSGSRLMRSLKESFTQNKGKMDENLSQGFDHRRVG
jgi:hypothetical protein